MPAVPLRNTSARNRERPGTAARDAPTPRGRPNGRVHLSHQAREFRKSKHRRNSEVIHAWVPTRHEGAKEQPAVRLLLAVRQCLRKSKLSVREVRSQITRPIMCVHNSKEQQT